MKRWPPLVLIVALLVGGLVVSRDGTTRAEDAPDDLDPATLLPVAAPSDALDGSWFCAGQSAGEDTAADGTLVVANVGDTSARGTVQVVAAGSDAERGVRPVVEPIELAARTTERIRLSELIEAEWVAARVQVEGGTVVVEREVVGEHGRDVAPCQSRAADSWLLPAGASTRDATFTLAIYNPYAGEARVDLAFTTEDSVREPPDFQGLAVGPGELVAVDVSGTVTERDVISTTVAATRGQVVVDRIQTYDGRGAATTDEEAEEEAFRREGLTVTPAVPAAQRVWAFPAGVRSDFVHEQVIVFNPQDEAAEVEVTVVLEDPERNGVLDPYPLTVPPGEFAVFDVDAADSIPVNVTHSITVRSENDVPVVAERTLAAGGEDAAYVGTAASTGSPVASERWAFATGPDAEVESGRLVVANPGTEAVEVELAAFGDGRATPVGTDAEGRDLSSFTLEPGTRREVVVEDLDDEQRSLEVVATGPVVAERRTFAAPEGAQADEADESDASSDEGGSSGGADDEDGSGDEDGSAGDEDGAPADDTETPLGASSALGVPLRQGLVELD